MGFFLNFLFAHVGVVVKNSEKNRGEKIFELDAAVFLRKSVFVNSTHIKWAI